ncbi:unnamed protein product [Gongylonema pulchrum]|uniref:39S ribosomal protein L22, mitochondrial n=1 Tax=Gongylonema pulchrum TaxID=637853 RepID=A0A183D1B0_9BILA|nr:unnamed protein product [Gongylonema pulchrum]
MAAATRTLSRVATPVARCLEANGVRSAARAIQHREYTSIEHGDKVNNKSPGTKFDEKDLYRTFKGPLGYEKASSTGILWEMVADCMKPWLWGHKIQAAVELVQYAARCALNQALSRPYKNETKVEKLPEGFEKLKHFCGMTMKIENRDGYEERQDNVRPM